MGICNSKKLTITVNVSPQNSQAHNSKYTFVKCLGEGASCQVHEVHDQNGEPYALKILNKKQPNNEMLYLNEIEILKKIKHPNILCFVDSFEDNASYRIISKLCTGGELFDRVKLGYFSEKVAAKLTQEMLRALDYCHSHDIIHRDLKPENFVFETDDSDSPMKLIDFGCARIAADDVVVKDVAGSPYYVAPEVLSRNVRTGKIWKASDMWSVGIIIFLFVCGFPPFNARNQESMFAKIQRGKYRFPAKKDVGFEISDSVKELISKLLDMDPGKRLTARQAYAHPWVQGDTAPEALLPTSIIDGLSNFRKSCRLKKAIARVMANRMSCQDEEKLRTAFARFDKNNDGHLGPNEITSLMAYLGKNEVDANHFYKEIDEDGDSNISYKELALGVEMARLASKSSVKQHVTFKLFDTDDNGFVDADELSKMCDGISVDEAAQMIREVDGDNDGRVNFDEWIKAMGTFKAITKSKKTKGISFNLTDVNECE